MSRNLEKLKSLLAELFQLDQAELDFGMYRIMNAKRDEITRFLENDLLPQVHQALGELKQSDRAAIEAELATAIEQAKELGVDPEATQKVKELRQRLAQTVGLEALESEVFSHLYNFFRRYYSEGDFISLRRYKEGVYAIPYEGEEVKLHWANRDQYYIKTSEYLRDYTFKLPDGKRVHFKLVEADTEKDNNRPANGNERRFILSTEQPLAEENGELVVRFEYRPDPEKRKQADLNAAAVDRILKQTRGFDVWRQELASLRPTEKNPNRTLLEKHLADYTARNTFDYFIHKDLGGFLRRELDFYIKNEVMHLDDIESESAPRVEQYLSKIKAIRRIAHKIIDFLAQIENFQKKLWLKKKFVVETQYCVTLDRVPEELYAEIAANDAQRDEWVRLFAIDEIEGSLANPGYSTPLTVDFLRANLHLVLDTRHFGEDFKQRLLASFDDLDEQTDGLLIHSENFQALNLLLERYKGQVKCIYIDPPYNTGNDGFPYRDKYQHSSWLSFLFDRISQASRLLSPVGAMSVSIDDTELARLCVALDIFGPLAAAEKIIWKKRTTPPNDKILGAQHEYALVYVASDADKCLNLRRRSPEQLARYRNPDNHPKGPWMPGDLMANVKGGRYVASLYFPIRNPNTGEEHYPSPGGNWRYSQETIQHLLDNDEIYFGEDGRGRPKLKRFLCDVKKGITWTTLWDFVPLNTQGSSEMANILGSMTAFENPKPVGYITDLIRLTGMDNTWALDFFAGSGTTAHAVINLNREDGGRRKYILVEMGEYFDSVLVPRIKKVVYSKDWKDGKPVSRGGVSHMFKYIRLESYVDTLNNLELKQTEVRQSLLEQHRDFREDYMLRYMLELESRGSASLLNLDRFEDPFSYTLEIATGTAGETKPTVVDLVETFNYLIGLRVKTIDHIRGVRVVTGTNPQGERVLILWRNTKEMDNDKLDEWFKSQGYNTKDQEFDVIYVNGDNNLENLRRPDQTWKVRLIEEDFRRLMFDVQDV